MSEQEKIKKETIESNLGHTLEDLYDDAFENGAQWQKEQMIEKACEWLSNLPLEDMTYKYNDFDSSEDWYEFIEDFRKAMEEEK